MTGTQDLVVHLKDTTDVITLLALTPEELASVRAALTRIRQQSRWPRPVKDLTVTTDNGKSVTIYGNTIDFISTSPSKGGP